MSIFASTKVSLVFKTVPPFIISVSLSLSKADWITYIAFDRLRPTTY